MSFIISLFFYQNEKETEEKSNIANKFLKYNNRESFKKYKR